MGTIIYIAMNSSIFGRGDRGGSVVSIFVDPKIPVYGQTIPRSSSHTRQHHLNVAQDPSRLS
jgi:hypothetical protein